MKIKPENLIARIGTSNQASIKLFEKLGFGIVKIVEVFDEAELRWGYQSKADSNSLSLSSSSMDEIKREWNLELPKDRIGVYDPI